MNNCTQVYDGTLAYKVRSYIRFHTTLPSNVYFHSHIIRAFYELSYDTFEITGPQMVLTMKLTTFAWNVWDSRRPVEVRSNVTFTNLTEPALLVGSGQMAVRKTGRKISFAA